VQLFSHGHQQLQRQLQPQAQAIFPSGTVRYPQQHEQQRIQPSPSPNLAPQPAPGTPGGSTTLSASSSSASSPPKYVAPFSFPSPTRVASIRNPLVPSPRACSCSCEMRPRHPLICGSPAEPAICSIRIANQSGRLWLSLFEPAGNGVWIFVGHRLGWHWLAKTSVGVPEKSISDCPTELQFWPSY
jgi:hypothetical protein